MNTSSNEADVAKPVSERKSEDHGSFGFGSMGCAIFMAVMVLCWLLSELFGLFQPTENVFFVLGVVAFGFGHLLGVVALFARQTVAWWGRAALATMWISVLVWLFAGFAILE